MEYSNLRDKSSRLESRSMEGDASNAARAESFSQRHPKLYRGVLIGVGTALLTAATIAGQYGVDKALKYAGRNNEQQVQYQPQPKQR